MVVEPQGARRLAPIAANLDDAAIVIGIASTRISSRRVDAVITRQDHRPAVIPELSWERERVRVAITLGRVVPVVVVRGQRVHAKAKVGRRIHRQSVVVAEQHAATGAGHQQLGRKGAVKGPQRARILDGHVGVEAHVNSTCRAFKARQAHRVVVETTRAEFTRGIAVALARITETRVASCTRLRRLEALHRRELSPTLMRPTRTRRTAIAGRRVQTAAERGLDQRLPRVHVLLVGLHRGRRVQRLRKERVQVRPGGTAHAVLRAGQRCARRYGLRRHGVDAEFLEQEELLRERLRTKARTGTTSGRNAIVAIHRCGWQQRHSEESRGEDRGLGTDLHELPWGRQLDESPLRRHLTPT